MSVESAVPIYPRLRRGLAGSPDGEVGRFVLFDQRRITQHFLHLAEWEIACINLCNGRRSLREIHADTIRLTSGRLIPIESITALIRRLDESLFLDNARFRDYLDCPDREPSCIGC